MPGMGTRPEPFKMATVFRAMHAAGADVQVLHTGHDDSMAWLSCDVLEMPARRVMAPERGSSKHASPYAVLRTKPHDESERRLTPRAVLVQGKPSSTAMLELASFYKEIPVGHVSRPHCAVATTTIFVPRR